MVFFHYKHSTRGCQQLGVSIEGLGGEMGGLWGQMCMEFLVPMLQECQLSGTTRWGPEGELENRGAHSPAFQVVEGRWPPAQRTGGMLFKEVGLKWPVTSLPGWWF